MPPLRGGHALCQGCGIPMVVRTVLDTIDEPVVVVNATGCLEVATTRFPTTAWNVPWLHVAFENAAAVASGVESAQRALRRAARAAGRRGGRRRRVRRRRRHVRHRPAGALRRARARPPLPLRLLRQRGVHEHRRPALRRDAVRRRARRPAPPALESFGKAQQRKDMTAIAVAHHVPYVAQAAATHWHDLSAKVERAAAADGPAVPQRPHRLPASAGATSRGCAAGSLDAAVDSRFWPLYEVVDGEYRLTYEPHEDVPVEDWLRSAEALRAPAPPGERGARRADPAAGRQPTGQSLRSRCEGGVPA